jgi:hypothetical protein
MRKHGFANGNVGLMDEEGNTLNNGMTWKTLGEGVSTTIVAAFDPSIAGTSPLNPK